MKYTAVYFFNSEGRRTEEYMSGKQNLKPFGKNSPLTESEQREIQSKGGKRSGEKRRERKAMKETLDTLLRMPIKSGKIYEAENIKDFNTVEEKNIDVQTKILVKAIQDYLKNGNPALLSFIRDTVGENPVTKIEADADMDLNIHIDYGGDNE